MFRAALEKLFKDVMPTDAQTTINERAMRLRTALQPGTSVVDLDTDIAGHVTEFPFGWLSQEAFKLGLGVRLLGNDAWFQ